MKIPTTVSFAADVQPIFTSRCVVCHNRTPEGDLNLLAASSYGNLVGVVSHSYAPFLRVKPGNPDASVLYEKISGAPQFGDPMPPPGGGPAVPLAERQTIRTWISEGALNN